MKLLDAVETMFVIEVVIESLGVVQLPTMTRKSWRR